MDSASVGKHMDSTSEAFVGERDKLALCGIILAAVLDPSIKGIRRFIVFVSFVSLMGEDQI